MRSSANFRKVFSESQSASPLDAEVKHILTQNDHSMNVKVRKIYREKEAKIVIFDHPTII